ncbi:MAG: nucleotidyl transferase AbiEii/AbiGii toxin family protein [Acidimicrobiales bacterium]
MSPPVPLLPSFPSLSTWPVYPLGLHVAEKVAAMHEIGDQQPSTRVHDLADLFIIANRHTFDGAALARTISDVTAMRTGVPLAAFAIPAGWDDRWLWFVERDRFRLAANYAEVSETVTAFIAPMLDAGFSGTWDPHMRAWQPAAL